MDLCECEKVVGVVIKGGGRGVVELRRLLAAV